MSEGGRRSSRTTKGKRQLDPSFVSSQELDGDDPQVQDEDDDDEKPKRRKSMNRTKSKTASPVVTGVPQSKNQLYAQTGSLPNIQYATAHIPPHLVSHVPLPNSSYQYNTYNNPYSIPTSTSQLQGPMSSIPRTYLDNTNMAALGLLPQMYSNHQTQQTTVVQPPPLMSVPHSSSSHSFTPTHNSTHTLPSISPSPPSHTVIPSYTSPIAHTSVPTAPTQSPKREMKCLILDIEGTTTPISFVADNLFPYVRKNLESWITTHWDSKQVQDNIEGLRKLAQEDSQKNVPGVIPILESDQKKEKIIESVVKNVFWQMDSDRKSTALKNLQGDMWKAGYEFGELKGEVFEDVLDVIKTLHSHQVPIFIYSSGSIAAQKLLFGYSINGDMTKYLSGYFDTTSGSKVETSSYQTILKEINRRYPGVTIPGQVLFITDNPSEVDAAQRAGILTIIADRPGNKQLPPGHKYIVIKSFKELIETNVFNWIAPQKAS